MLHGMAMLTAMFAVAWLRTYEQGRQQATPMPTAVITTPRRHSLPDARTRTRRAPPCIVRCARLRLRRACALAVVVPVSEPSRWR